MPIWRGVLFWSFCGFFGLFALMLLYDGIRLWWRGEPPELEQEAGWGWRAFQAVTFGLLYWWLDGVGGQGYSVWIMAAALTFFFTYILDKMFALVRWLSGRRVRVPRHASPEPNRLFDQAGSRRSLPTPIARRRSY